MMLPRTPRPSRPMGRRAFAWLVRWLGKLGHADMAIGPGELMAIIGVFAFAGLTVGGTIGEILRPSAKFFFQAGGGLIAAFLVQPVRKIKAVWGYLGIAGAVLLAVLTSYGAGSVGRMVTFSRETVTAVRLEMGDTSVASDVCIKETSYQLGLLTREETDRLCGYETKVQKSAEGEDIVRYQKVPKPNPLLYIWELVKLSVVVVVLVFIFKKP